MLVRCLVNNAASDIAAFRLSGGASQYIHNDLKGSGSDVIEVLSRVLPVRTAEDDENISCNITSVSSETQTENLSNTRESYR
jgi:hypothetical protein